MVDFFAVLMPGALTAYAIREQASRALFDQPAPTLDHAEAWVVFLFVSYLFGHVLFLFGARLDDLLYDSLRGCSERKQAERLAEGKSLSPRWARKWARSDWFFGKSADAALTEAIRIKIRALRGIVAPDAINAFQWSKARLSKQHRPGLVAVERFEADSKFFRSFSVALIVLAVAFFAAAHPGRAIVCLAFVLPALWRYIEQRFKATQQAYWQIITLEGLKRPSTAPSEPPRADGLTHAGGVVFRRHGAGVQYLLVEATRTPGEWVLPKGRIEVDEDPATSATREVREETGVWARVIERLNDVPMRDARVSRFFLMEALEPMGEDDVVAGTRATENRAHRWAPAEEAKRLTRFPETHGLLDLAERRSPEPEEQGAAAASALGSSVRGAHDHRGA